MGKKNIVSIEDRIPKLKEARKKKANKRLITYLTIFFVLVLMVVYLQTPLSNVKTIKVVGNEQLSEDTVIQLSGLSTDTSLWSVDKEKTGNKIASNPEVRSVEVERNLPSTITIHIDEYDRVGYVPGEENTYYPVLESGEILHDHTMSNPKGDAPLLQGFNDQDVLLEMTQELKDLPLNIRDLISEIYWNPKDGNKTKLLLYMTDGFVVDGAIRNFSDRMRAYPSIVSQIEPGTKGIVHIGVGAYFESFDDGVEEESEDQE